MNSEVVTEVKRKDRIFIALASIVWALTLIVTAIDFIIIQLPIYRFDLVIIAGVVLIAVGVTIRLTAKKTLGRFYTYTLRLQENHKLIRTGIYKNIRHPGYLGTLLVDVGIPLIFHSVYGFLVALILIPLFIYRVKAEEDMLIAKFGDEYKTYMKTSWALVPHVY